MKCILLLFIVMSSWVSLAQTNSCLEKIKTGKFEYNSQGTTVNVKRKRRKQIEYYNNGKSKIVNKIEWVSESEYILTFKKEKNSPGCLNKGDKMTLTILECSEEAYKVKIMSKNCGNAEVVIKIID